MNPTERQTDGSIGVAATLVSPSLSNAVAAPMKGLPVPAQFAAHYTKH